MGTVTDYFDYFISDEPEYFKWYVMLNDCGLQYYHNCIIELKVFSNFFNKDATFYISDHMFSIITDGKRNLL